MQPVIATTSAGNPAGPPPSKKVKNDVRAATLKFLSSAMPQSPVVPEFDRYLSASIDDDIDALQLWAVNQSAYPQMAAVARQSICIPSNGCRCPSIFAWNIREPCLYQYGEKFGINIPTIRTRLINSMLTLSNVGL